MRRKKLSVALFVTLEQILLIIYAWIMERILDFVWNRFKSRIRFKARLGSMRVGYLSFLEAYVRLVIGLYVTSKEPSRFEKTLYSRPIRFCLLLHKRIHKISGKKKCRVCPVIEAKRHDIELYGFDLSKVF